MSQRRILIVDDERDIIELLSYNLAREGYEVAVAYDGEQALAVASAFKPEIVLLDIMLPKLDGVEVCRQLRLQEAFRDTSILFLTARAEEYSEVAGFEAGADDYITKPIKPRALLERLKAVHVGRSPLGSPDAAAEDPALIGGDLHIVPEEYLIRLHGEEIVLPRKEFELLYFLAKNSNRVFRREELLIKIWDNIHVTERTVDVHVRKLRIKIGKKYIHTIKGVGYRFVWK